MDALVQRLLALREVGQDALHIAAGGLHKVHPHQRQRLADLVQVLHDRHVAVQDLTHLGSTGKNSSHACRRPCRGTFRCLAVTRQRNQRNAVSRTCRVRRMHAWTPCSQCGCPESRPAPHGLHGPHTQPTHAAQRVPPGGDIVQYEDLPSAPGRVSHGAEHLLKDAVLDSLTQ